MRLASFAVPIMSLKTVTVFCGSSLGNDPRFEESPRGKVVLINLMRLFYIFLRFFMGISSKFCSPELK